MVGGLEEQENVVLRVSSTVLESRAVSKGGASRINGEKAWGTTGINKTIASFFPSLSEMS